MPGRLRLLRDKLYAPRAASENLAHLARLAVLTVRRVRLLREVLQLVAPVPLELTRRRRVRHRARSVVLERIVVPAQILAPLVPSDIIPPPIRGRVHLARPDPSRRVRAYPRVRLVLRERILVQPPELAVSVPLVIPLARVRRVARSVLREVIRQLQVLLLAPSAERELIV